MSYWKLTVVVLLACLDTSDGFRSTNNGKHDVDSFTHRNITQIAIRQLAKSFMYRHPDQYPDPGQTMRSESFKQALKDFRSTVAKPDADEQHKPEAHFHNERFPEGSARLVEMRQIVVTSIRSSSMKNAREFAGRALHGLQDFYSHSNWVEMGNRDPYPQLGEKRIGADEVARPDEPTCSNCNTSAGDGQCRNNIYRRVNDNRLLTSGYYAPMSDASRPTVKPRGKCSHGGGLDASSLRPPRGGINKDSFDAALSPHNYLHQQAANLAIRSTVDFLDSIRVAVIKEEFVVFEHEAFAEFLGIPVGSATTLCFIVGTTGSMNDEIAAVRDITIRMTNMARISAGPKPSDYVLSPFNDRTYGPLFKTADPAQMIRQLSGLTADGGGDTPELAFHGIQLALQEVRIGSTCHLFTDAPAKDVDMYPAIVSLAQTKKVKINSFLTSVGKKRRRKRSTFDYFLRLNDYFDSLSRLTGGSVLSIANSDISKVVEVVSVDSAPSRVSVFVADSLIHGFTFFVDISMTNVVVQITGSSCSLQSVTFTSPAGEAFRDYTEILNLTSIKLLNLTTLTPGAWLVNVSSGGRPFSAAVTATSVLSFKYQFATLREDSASFDAISGNPVAGDTFYILIDVDGADDPLTDRPTNVLNNLTAVLLVSEDEYVVDRLPATEIAALREYNVMTSSVLPGTAFRVAVEGHDTAGNIIQRFEPAVISVLVVKLGISVQSNDSFSVFPGSFLDVVVNVTRSVGLGNRNTWYIRVSDTGNFYVRIGSNDVTTVSLNKNEFRLLSLRFQVPPNAIYGFVSTVTVTVGSAVAAGLTSSFSWVENYVVFYISVKSRVTDDIQPSCTIDRLTGECNGARSTSETSECMASSWSAHFHVRDAESGLKSVGIQPRLSTGHNYTLRVDSFSEGSNATVSGVYTSSCCYPDVTLLAVDVLGNVGRCAAFNDPVPPSCTLIEMSGLCGTLQSSSCQSQTWQATLQVSDAGSGLFRIEADTRSTDYLLEPNGVKHGTTDAVNTTYSSSCCRRSAVVRIADVAGNVANCSVVAPTLRSRETRNIASVYVLVVAILLCIGNCCSDLFPYFKFLIRN